MHILQNIYKKNIDGVTLQNLHELRTKIKKQESDIENKMSDLTDVNDMENILSVVNSKAQHNYTNSFFEKIDNDDSLKSDDKKSLGEKKKIIGQYSDKRIIVMGFYDHNNIGDEQYKLTFKYIFDTYLPENYEIIYLNFDKISRFVFFFNRHYYCWRRRYS